MAEGLLPESPGQTQALGPRKTWWLARAYSWIGLTPGCCCLPSRPGALVLTSLWPAASGAICPPLGSRGMWVGFPLSSDRWREMWGHPPALGPTPRAKVRLSTEQPDCPPHRPPSLLLRPARCLPILLGPEPRASLRKRKGGFSDAPEKPPLLPWAGGLEGRPLGEGPGDHRQVPLGL